MRCRSGWCRIASTCPDIFLSISATRSSISEGCSLSPDSSSLVTSRMVAVELAGAGAAGSYPVISGSSASRCSAKVTCVLGDFLCASGMGDLSSILLDGLHVAELLHELFVLQDRVDLLAKLGELLGVRQVGLDLLQRLAQLEAVLQLGDLLDDRV